MHKSISAQSKRSRTLCGKVKKCVRYILLYILIAILCYGAMYLAGLIPTSALTAHTRETSEILFKERNYPQMLEQDVQQFRMDNFSEALIIMHSYFLDSKLTPSSVLLNSAWRNPDPSSNNTPVDNLAQALSGDWEPPTGTRSHYWMGFRTIVRPLLAFTNLHGIRRLIQSVFFAVFFICVILIAKRVSTWCAAAFGLSVMAVYPFVVSNSLQFSCDFLLAFSGIIAVILMYPHCESGEGIIFLILGQLTQYFDFYTTPILTWGMPFLVLYALHYKREPNQSLGAQLRLLFGTLSIWLLAYGGMWLIKMILVTVGSSHNGFSILKSFLYYTGIEQNRSGVNYIGVAEALKRNYENMNSGIHLLFYGSFALSAVIAAVYKYISQRKRQLDARLSPAKMRMHFAVLLCAAVPIIWLACARQAAGTHQWYQYRSLALAVFAFAYWWYLFLHSVAARAGAAK